MDKLNVGVIGLGVGEQHLIGLREHDNCSVVAVADISPDKLSAVNARYSDLLCYSEAEKLIEDPAIDLIVIASYDDAHHKQVVRSIRAGKHVFVEKPLCTNEEELMEIQACLKANPDIRLSTNTILRMSPRFRGLHADIQSGAMGRIYFAEADYNYGRLEKLTHGWRGRIPNYSVMLGGGVHMVDLLLWLTGRHAIEVFAVGNGLSSVDSSYQGLDMVMASIRFEDEIIGKVSANFGCVYPHFHRVTVYGTEATFENGINSARLFRSRDISVSPIEVDTPYPGVAKSGLLPSFIDAVLGRGRAEIEEKDVFETMRVCFSIERSLREGRPVSVGDIPGGQGDYYHG